MKNIAIIAHDEKKPLMAEFLKDKREWISTVSLLATGRTAKLMEQSGIDIRHMSPGKSGGYQEIIALIDKGEVDIVFFFMDPKVERPYHNDIEELLDICVNKNIPLALNRTSAEMLILGLIKYRAYEKHVKKKEFLQP